MEKTTRHSLLGGWSQRELLSAGHQIINTRRSLEGKKYLPSG
jgi:hypothetical protein